MYRKREKGEKESQRPRQNKSWMEKETQGGRAEMVNGKPVRKMLENGRA